MIANLQQQHRLAPYTAWHIGGPAELYFKPKNRQELQNYLRTHPLHPEKITWLGLGSNVLIPDQGLSGLLIHTLNALTQLECLNDPEHHTVIYAEAGVTCAKFSKFAAKQGFMNAEFFSGIPGTMGGALFMNAGAWGFETWQAVCFVDLIHRSGEISRHYKNEFEIGYRSVKPRFSIHQETTGQSHWFLGAGFQFPQGDQHRAETKIQALLRERQLKQPIGTYNCGSVFKNPPGQYAAQLIEDLKLKGHQIGDAIVSPKHGNFIINLGRAQANQVLALVEHIETTVLQAYGIRLEREFKLLS